MGNDLKRTSRLCPHCQGALLDDYLKLHPFPEIPCPSCGSLIESSRIKNVSMPADNERREKRCNVALRVSYKSFHGFITEYTLNVSKGGMFIHTNEIHNVGDLLDVTIDVPGLDQSVSILGVVAHVKYYEVKEEEMGVGIKFVDIDETSRRHIIDFLKSEMECI